MCSVLSAGVWGEQIQDALAIYLVQHDRSAGRWLRVLPAGPKGFEAGTKYLLGHGYR